jgi:hypothetical protein
MPEGVIVTGPITIGVNTTASSTAKAVPRTRKVPRRCAATVYLRVDRPPRGTRYS